jgi:c-di-GMP-binding flagellar brake protein YcgR
MMMYNEKRIDNRAEISAQARYKILSDSEGTTSYDYENGLTKNISKSGVCLTVEHKLSEGSVIRVEIPSFDFDIETESEKKIIKAFCEVQWCSKPKDQNNYEVGLSFIALKEEDLDYLNNVVLNYKRAM